MADDRELAGTAALLNDISKAAADLRRNPAGALRAAADIVKRDPSAVGAILLCAAALRQLGRADAAAKAEADAVAVSSRSPEIAAARQAFEQSDLQAAERMLRARLARHPSDVLALRMLASLAIRLGHLPEAETLLRKAVGFAPSVAGAREDLVLLLSQLGKRDEGLAVLDTLIADEPDNLRYVTLKAAALNKVGRHEQAKQLFDEVIAREPDHAGIWLAYGSTLRTLGALDESVSAYRRAVQLSPLLGSGWWALANLKTFRFDADDVATMRTALGGQLSNEERAFLLFALGKACEDRGEYEESFGHYAEANRLRRQAVDYDPDALSRYVEGNRRTLTAGSFAQRSGYGDPSSAPIFIIGMHRAGSTLVEQILASHSAVEGTAELTDIPLLARRLGAGPVGSDNSDYLRRLTELGGPEAARLGADYLELSGIQRGTERPRYTDKLPGNWLHAGLIHLILPNARIIDVRRHPLDCCLSNFRQSFADAVPYAYDLAELGRFYRDYVGLMDHVDAVLPGRVHRIIYEELVGDPDAVVGALLEHLELPFEQGCLRFHETERAVRTPSSEQVRQPINRGGIGRWQEFEPWLRPLKHALGDVLDSYPDSPGRVAAR